MLAGRPVTEYAKSCIYLARFYLQMSPRSIADTEGDQQQQFFLFAKQYLKEVSNSNAEETGIATDLLRRLNKLNVLDAGP
jgi:hypothetical protein